MPTWLDRIVPDCSAEVAEKPPLHADAAPAALIAEPSRRRPEVRLKSAMDLDLRSEMLGVERATAALRRGLRRGANRESSKRSREAVEHDRDESLGAFFGQWLLPEKAQQWPEVFGIEIAS